MNLADPTRAMKIPATTVAALVMAGLLGYAGLRAPTALAQSTIPAQLTQLRPIKGIAYDPKPSDFPQPAYFDSDFFNSDFTAIWGDDGSGSRNDLQTFKDAGINFLHLYNWNAQRVNHTAFLDAAHAHGMTVMVPISNFTAGTIDGNTPGCNCPFGYQAAFNLVKGIFDQVYGGGASPHPAVAMWGIFNEYDLNKIDPLNVVFVIQAILTLEDQAGIPPANRLPITAPVSDAMFDRAHRGALSRTQAVVFERATLQWLATNPGKNVDTSDPPDLPGAVLAILAIANSLEDAQARTTYKSKFDSAPVAVSPVPADFWKTRFIASANPFREGPALANYVTSPAQFQSAFPGTTLWNTLPPLFFAEMGFSQVDAGHDLSRQASVVLGQIRCTHPLAVSAGTPQGYFLGSAFFQHTFVDASHFEAFQVVPGQFSTHTASQPYRVDVLTALPQWGSVQHGYAADTATCP